MAHLKVRHLLVGILAVSPLSWGAPAESFYPLDTKLEGGTNEYAEQLLKVVRKWPEGRAFCKWENEPLKIHMVKMPDEDRPYAMGFKKCMGISAPFAAVTSVIEDFEHYQELFPGDKEVKVAGKDKNKTTMAWERKIPVFFVPNEKYQMNHLAVAVGPGIKMYRAQLKQGDRLKRSDALVVVESKGPNFTLYTDYEFYEADYSVGLFGIKAVGVDEAWRESLVGSYLSLLALRMKAEHPKMTYEQITKSSEEAFKGTDLTRITSGKIFENEKN